MRYWASPFSLSASACAPLIEAGVQPWPEGCSFLPKDHCLLLYDSPDQLITMAGACPEAQEATTPLSLLQGYRLLLTFSEQTGQPLLSISQLQRLGPQGLRTWFLDGPVTFPAPPTPPPTPASVTFTPEPAISSAAKSGRLLCP